MKWIRRAGLALVTVIVLAVLVGAGYEAAGRRRAAKDFPAPGKLVNIGGRRIQIDCRGSGTPTVVLEDGLDRVVLSAGQPSTTRSQRLHAHVLIAERG